MNRPATFGSLLSCLLLCLCVLAIGTAGISGETAPAPARVTSQQHAVALPAALVPIVARNLATRSPQTWRAHVTASHGAVFSNPAQQLTANFNHNATVLQLSDKLHDQITMQLTADRVGNVTQPLKFGAPSANGNRVELSHGTGLMEWYVNSPLGVEQGFTITASPKSAALRHSLTLVFSLHGNLTPVLKGNAVEFTNAAGQRVLRYGNLLAWDARHHTLPTKLQLQDRSLLLSVNTAGAHFPVTVDPLFSSTVTFNDPAAAASDFFGISVALSADGTTAIIGTVPSPLPTMIAGPCNVSTVYLYTQSNGTWPSTPTQAFSDPSAALRESCGYFGGIIALSADGSTVLIADATYSPVPGKASVGAAFLYVRSNGTWSGTPTQTFINPAPAIPLFGSSAALSADGSTAIIGAPNATVLGPAGVGAAYVYAKNSGAWSGTPTYTFSDPFVAGPNGENNEFGSSVALSADGSTALVGADLTTVSSQPYAGAAYVYSQSNGIWSGTPTQTFSDPVAAEFDSFGSSVALSADGTTALIGAFATMAPGLSGDAGAAYVYSQSHGTWSDAPAHTFSSNDVTGVGGYFGKTVALSADGNTALIGSYEAAYVYTQSNGAWPSTATQTLSDPSGASSLNGIFGNFGFDVALSADANTVLIGADGSYVSSQAAAGAAYAFTTATTTPPPPKRGGGGGGFGWLSLMLLAPLVKRKKIFPSL